MDRLPVARSTSAASPRVRRAVDPDRAAVDRAEAHGARAAPDGDEAVAPISCSSAGMAGAVIDRVLPSARIAAAASSALIS